jgi:hypothetical protein
MTYAYVREGKSRKDLDAMVANAVAQAEADQKLTNEQREKAIATFRALGAKLAKLQPLPQNTELVEKIIGKAAPVMKIQQKCHSRESGNPVTPASSCLLDCPVKPGNDKAWMAR